MQDAVECTICDGRYGGRVFHSSIWRVLSVLNDDAMVGMESVIGMLRNEYRVRFSVIRTAMSPTKPRTLTYCCLAAALPLLTSCASNDVSPTDSFRSAAPAVERPNYTRFQLIVKFKPTLVPRVDAAVVDRLSRDTGVTFVYIRAMSGGAHVLAVTQPLSSEQRAALLRRLRTHTDIEYVDEDRLMRPVSR